VPYQADERQRDCSTKREGRRHDCVTERTRLDPVIYLRQSKTELEEADQAVVPSIAGQYQGFFYSDAQPRANRDGLKLFRFFFGLTGPKWEGLVKAGLGDREVVSAELIRTGTPEVRAICYIQG